MVLYLAIFSLSQNVTLAVAPEVALQDRSIPQIVEHFADKYNVSSKQMLSIMKCESSLDPTKQSEHYYTKDNHKLGIKKGQRELSFGLSQIHLPAHPDITEEQAKDPVFAAEFMAKNFSEGHQRKWTCWRKLYL